MNMQVKSDFVDNAPLSELQRLRSYSRLTEENLKETWDETVNRVLYSPYLGLKVLGKFTDEEMQLIDEMQRNKIAFGSARGLWVLGTEWYTKDGNESGTYNCTSLEVTSFEIMAELMNLAMMGCGTGAVIEPKFINQIPVIRNKINVQIIGKPGLRAKKDRVPETQIHYNCPDNALYMVVGDSREGWVSAYLETLKLAISTDFFELHPVELTVDVSNVRPKGEILKGFGGVSNPIKLPDMFGKLANIINGATGRQLTSLEVCLLIDEAALVVVSGNLRRSAGMRQGESHDEIFNTAKDNLWQQDSEGNWFIDPKRDALRMANHTRVFHHKPTLEEVKESVTKQFYSGEGAIQYAPEAIARANVDILDTPEKKKQFLVEYEISSEAAGRYLLRLALGKIQVDELLHRLSRYGLNPLTLAA